MYLHITYIINKLQCRSINYKVITAENNYLFNLCIWILYHDVYSDNIFMPSKIIYAQNWKSITSMIIIQVLQVGTH